MLHNLISNAIKFTPSGGTVKIILNRVNKPSDLSISDSLLEKTVLNNSNRSFLEF